MAAQIKSDSIFELLKGYLVTDEGQEIKKKINFVYQINLSPKKIGFDEVIYTIDLKKGEVIKGPYQEGNPDATISLKDEDFVKLVMGKLNPQMAFMRSRAVSALLRNSPLISSQSFQRCELRWLALCLTNIVSIPPPIA